MIPDLHFPYCHIDSLDFLHKIKKFLNPTRIISLGDELDYSAMNFHESNVDMPSAGQELLLGLGYIDTLHELFPKMDILHSNHGSMAYRKAKHAGMPIHLLKSYNELMQIPTTDWKWHERLIIELPNKTKCCFAHSLGTDVLKASQSIGMSLVQGHHHSQFEIRYWQNYDNLSFAITSGCLIDDTSMAFAYNKLQIKRPIMGVTFIENSVPTLIPMITNENNRWIGTKI